jgi:integrase
MLDKEQEWLASLISESTKLHHAKAFLYLKEFLGMDSEEILELRRKEGKRFTTEIVLFWKFLQDKKKLSKSTASNYVFGASSFFSYYDLELRLKNKIPDTQMKIDVNIPTLENLQNCFRLGDLQTKTVLGLMRDCPCRVGDLVKKVIPRMTEGTFLIESEKENVPGRVYISEMTLGLATQLQKSGLELPTTKRGIAKMLERICKIAGVPVFNPHIMRKIFFDTGCHLNVNRDILRILMFKTVNKDVLTYILSRDELREAWQQIVNSIPLEKVNGKANQLDVDTIAMALAKIIKRELGQSRGQYSSESLALMTEESPMETIKRFLES